MPSPSHHLLFTHASEDFIKLNRGLFATRRAAPARSPARALGAVAPRQLGQPPRALEHQAPPQPRRGRRPHGGLARGSIVVCLTACLPGHPFDGHDNLRTALKALVDAIAQKLGLDDSDPAITWEYAQQHTTGSAGVLVKIETRPHGPRS